jgi:hypothetical protein
MTEIGASLVRTCPATLFVVSANAPIGISAAVTIAIANPIFGLIRASLDDRFQVTKLADSNATPFCRSWGRLQTARRSQESLLFADTRVS